MKKKLLLVMVLGVIFSSVGCNQIKNDAGAYKLMSQVKYPKIIGVEDYDAQLKNIKDNPVDISFKQALSQFTYKTSSKILSDNIKNQNFSPISLYYGLSMATIGSENNTKKELLSLLGMDSTEDLLKQSGNMYRVLYDGNEDSKLKIANSIWINRKFTIKNSFIKNATNNFYASVFKADFENSKTEKAMGKWIMDNTNGTLNPEIKVASEELVNIINTIYFKDQWENEIDETKNTKDNFKTLDKNDVSVEYMNTTVNTSFFEGDNFTRASIKLKNGNMVFILPKDGVNIKDLLVSKKSLETSFVTGNESEGMVTFKIPKFSFDNEFSLIDTLKQLGVNDAFENSADFYNMTDNNVFISKIDQGTHIDVNEKGVESSAYTQVAIKLKGALLDSKDVGSIILDKPFIYGIEYKNGDLLFIGTVTDPTNK